MPEGKQILYTPWEDQREAQTECYPCRRNKSHSCGVLMKRRVTGRDGESHTEYKIECPICGAGSGVYRSKQLTIIAWNARQEPDDGLKRRRQGIREMVKL